MDDPTPAQRRYRPRGHAVGVVSDTRQTRNDPASKPEAPVPGRSETLCVGLSRLVGRRRVEDAFLFGAEALTLKGVEPHSIRRIVHVHDVRCDDNHDL